MSTTTRLEPQQPKHPNIAVFLMKIQLQYFWEFFSVHVQFTFVQKALHLYSPRLLCVVNQNPSIGVRFTPTAVLLTECRICCCFHHKDFLIQFVLCASCSSLFYFRVEIEKIEGKRGNSQKKSLQNVHLQ